MSAEDRTELAAAVNTVEGVSCTPHYRASTKAGDACVLLLRMTPDSKGFGYVTTYQIWISLWQDVGRSEQWIDAHHDEIAAALKREWVPTQVYPQWLPFDGQQVFGVIYEGTR